MPQRRRRLVVDRQVVARQESRRRLPLQLRRSLARQLPPNHPISQPTAQQQHAQSQGYSPEVEDLPKAIRGLRQGTALHNSQDTRDLEEWREAAGDTGALKRRCNSVSRRVEELFRPHECRSQCRSWARPLSFAIFQSHCARSLSYASSHPHCARSLPCEGSQSYRARSLAREGSELHRQSAFSGADI